MSAVGVPAKPSVPSLVFAGSLYGVEAPGSRMKYPRLPGTKDEAIQGQGDSVAPGKTWRTKPNWRARKGDEMGTVTGKSGDAVSEEKGSFSRCKVCKRPLKSPESMARGMGPVCIGKRGDKGSQGHLELDKNPEAT